MSSSFVTHNFIHTLDASHPLRFLPYTYFLRHDTKKWYVLVGTRLYDFDTLDEADTFMYMNRHEALHYYEQWARALGRKDIKKFLKKLAG